MCSPQSAEGAERKIFHIFVSNPKLNLLTPAGPIAVPKADNISLGVLLNAKGIINFLCALCASAVSILFN
jgi:hypothetical protein